MPWNDQMAQALAGAADLRTLLKFMFSEKAKKNDEIFIVDLTLCSKLQIDS